VRLIRPRLKNLNKNPEKNRLKTTRRLIHPEQSKKNKQVKLRLTTRLKDAQNCSWPGVRFVIYKIQQPIVEIVYG